MTALDDRPAPMTAPPVDLIAAAHGKLAEAKAFRADQRNDTHLRAEAQTLAVLAVAEQLRAANALTVLVESQVGVKQITGAQDHGYPRPEIAVALGRAVIDALALSTRVLDT